MKLCLKYSRLFFRTRCTFVADRYWMVIFAYMLLIDRHPSTTVNRWMQWRAPNHRRRSVNCPQILSHVRLWLQFMKLGQKLGEPLPKKCGCRNRQLRQYDFRLLTNVVHVCRWRQRTSNIGGPPLPSSLPLSHPSLSNYPPSPLTSLVWPLRRWRLWRVCYQVSVVFELGCPVEDTSQVMYGRQRREPPPRSPVRVVLVLDVSHSMAEPHGSSVDNTTASQVQYIMFYKVV